MVKTLIDTLTTDENGQASYTYEGEGAGSIGFVAEYEEKSSSTLTIDDYIPAADTITLIADTYSINYGDTVTLTATVKDQHNQAITGATVTFKNGSTSIGTGTTNSNGVATLIKTGLNAGTYNITAETGGVSSSAKTVTVNKLNTALSISVPALIYSDTFDVTGVLEDSNGVGISGATVKIIWNDGTSHNATATTDANGEVTFHRDAPTTITDYTFQLQYEATTNYNASNSSTVTRTVGKETSVLNVTSPTAGAAITGSTFTVAGTLLDNDGTAMSGKSVVVKLGTTTLTTFTTNTNGAWSGSINSSVLSDGSNTLSFVFDADTYYTGASQQVTVSKVSFDGITVASDKSILSAADGDSATLSAQLTLGGSAVSISGVSVTFNVYKESDDSLVETLTGTTNSSGLASVSYLGEGAGDLYIQSVSGSFSSETYEVCDTYKYYTDTYTQGNSNRQIAIGLELPSSFRITYKSKINNSSNCYAQLIYGKTYGTLDYLINHNVQRIDYLKRVNSSSVTTITSTGNNYPVNTTYEFDYQYENGVHTLLVDNVQVFSVTDTSVEIANLLYWSLRNATVSDLKIFKL